MATTDDHNLHLIADGATPWGNQARENLQTIDAALPFVQATMWALDNDQVTAIAEQGVPVKANIPNTQGVSPCGCMTFFENRMLYDGAERVLTLVCSFALNAVGNNKTFRVYLAHDGAVLDHATAKARDTVAGDIASGALTGLVAVETGSTIELWVANLTDDTNVTVVDVSMSARG